MFDKFRGFALPFALLLAFGCERTPELQQAQEHAAKIDEAMNASSSNTTAALEQGSIPPGCYMRAVIDGKKWEATSMTPDVSIPSLVSVNGRRDGSLITFVMSGKPENVGNPSELSEMNTITYWESNDAIYGAKSGQITVRKLDDNFLEGTFRFTAEENGKKVVCTDGEFRIPSPTAKPAG